MNTRQEFKDDPIRRYLDRERGESAPSGFTEKVMSRINLEARPLKAGSGQKQKSYVPAISLAVILILTGIAFTLPSEGNSFIQMPLMKFFHNAELHALNINVDALFRFKLPEYLPYLFITILLLSVFDRALSGLFHRTKNHQTPKI